jgi:hypothetical protein
MWDEAKKSCILRLLLLFLVQACFLPYICFNYKGKAKGGVSIPRNLIDKETGVDIRTRKPAGGGGGSLRKAHGTALI